MGVYIQQAPFVKNAIFGLNFKVLLEYSRRCNLVIWNPQALPNKMPKTVCRNSVWFAFYGTLKSAHLGPEMFLSFFLSFFLLCFLRRFSSPDLIRILLELAQWNLVHTFLASFPMDYWISFWTPQNRKSKKGGFWKANTLGVSYCFELLTAHCFVFNSGSLMKKLGTYIPS